jgi:hypothetical protein
MADKPPMPTDSGKIKKAKEKESKQMRDGSEILSSLISLRSSPPNRD